MMQIRWLPVLGFACLLSAATAPAEESLTDLCREIRGANYTPSYTSTSIGTWTNFDAQVIKRELEFAQRLNLNSMRVFLSYVAYQENPTLFVERVREFVTLAAKHNIRPMFVLYDSCFGKEPSMDEVASEMWVNNPGYSRIAAEDWSGLEAYVDAVVSNFKDDSRVLMWDIMNEPMADFEHVTRQERDQIWEFCLHFCRRVKTIDARHPITVGHAVVEYVPKTAVVEYIPKTAEVVDVLSIHSYSRYDDWLQQDIDLALHYGRQYGKPVIFTEFGNPGAGQKYEMALQVIERNQLGFYFWELMIAKVMFKNMAGLIYADGSVRDLQPIAALVLEEVDSSAVETETVSGFKQKVAGGIPQTQPPDGTHLRNFLAESDQWETLVNKVTNAPRTVETIRASVPSLALLGRHLCRPDLEAQRVFELALSIPHHFRLGREKQGVEDFEELLDIVKRAVKQRSAGRSLRD
jgi:hypothetical protein